MMIPHINGYDLRDRILSQPTYNLLHLLYVILCHVLYYHYITVRQRHKFRDRLNYKNTNLYCDGAN